MNQEIWDAKEFVDRYLAGDGELVDMLADFSLNQLTEIEHTLCVTPFHLSPSQYAPCT